VLGVTKDAKNNKRKKGGEPERGGECRGKKYKEGGERRRFLVAANPDHLRQTDKRAIGRKGNSEKKS